MRVIIKIFAAPLLAVLFILCPVFDFVFIRIGMLLKLLAGICLLTAIVFFVQGKVSFGIFFLVTAFLISPLGIPLIVEWLIDRLYTLRDALIDFIKS